MSARDDRELPLTERPAPPPSDLSADDQLIRTLVAAFYGSIRTDPLLGPIFAAHVTDWPAHLAKMEDFWSSMVLRTGRYSGRPIQAHMKLEGLTTEHFDRWLALWRDTVHRLVPQPPARAAFLNAAHRMAANMHAAIIGDD